MAANRHIAAPQLQRQADLDHCDLRAPGGPRPHATTLSCGARSKKLGTHAQHAPPISPRPEATDLHQRTSHLSQPEAGTAVGLEHRIFQSRRRQDISLRLDILNIIY
jgi:hypothetical protein